MATEPSPPRPLRLIAIFNQVPEVADLVVKELDSSETAWLMTKTDPGLTAFCEGAGGGLDRFRAISRVGKRERKRISRLPSLPRLLGEEWQKKLIGKRLVDEDEEGDETVGKAFQLFFRCLLFISMSVFLGVVHRY